MDNCTECRTPSADHASSFSTQKALQNFTSQWFLIPQGTGIIAVILHQLDYQFTGLHVISYIFWVLAIISLLTSVALYLARCILFPRRVLASLQRSQEEAACLTSICITYTSIIQMMSLTLVSSWGPGWGAAAHVLWWINVGVAFLSVVGVPFVLVRVYPGRVSHLSPASQLPLIAALTVAAGGGTVAQNAGIGPRSQVPVIVVSYLFIGLLLWGMGTFWWIWAVTGILQAATGRRMRWKGIPFELSAWSLVFPWVCLFRVLFKKL